MDEQYLKTKVKKLLIAMGDFLKENPIEKEELHPEHKYLLEELYQHLKYMNAKSLRYIFDHFTTSEKARMAKQIFLRAVPQVGTLAVWEFVKDIITTGDTHVAEDMPEETRLMLLRKLPMYVSKPSLNFARQMAGYMNLEGKAVGYHVKGAGVLAYSILLNKVIEAEGYKELPLTIDNELRSFYDRIRYENTYKNKILYMMALRNVGVGIYKYLAPIVRSEDVFYVDVMIEKREKYRIAAMWAVAKSISHDYDKTHDLFWPILANASLPLSMRITAYELLVPRNPLLDMRILMKVHELMSTERDEHLFNYHYTTLKSNSESTSPCMQMHAANMRKVLHMTKSRRVLSAALSTAGVHDYYDRMYEHGKAIKMAAEVNEATGVPQTGYYEVVSTRARRPITTSGYYWSIDGINLNTVIELAKNVISPSAHISTGIADEKIQQLLRKTQGHKLFDKHIHVELWTIEKGYVTDVQVYFENGLTDLLRDLVERYKPDFDQLMGVEEKYNIDKLDLTFFNRYEMHVTTDLGLPAYFTNDVPYISYMKLKPHLYPQKNIAMRLEFDSRIHIHSVYAMKVFNPILDVTHGVERRIVADAALPLDVTFSLQMPSQALKLELPRVAKQTAGFRIKSVDQVVIGRDEVKNNLAVHCPSCENRTDITNGPMYKKTSLGVMQHLDSGLEFSYGMIDCEHEFEPSAEMQEWFRIVSSPKNNWKHDVFVKMWMIANQGMYNYMTNPYSGACGVIMKAAPSTIYPVSHVEMNWRASVPVVRSETKLHLRGNIDVKSAKSNETLRNWEIDLSTELSRYLNAFTAKLTRKTPDEKNLKVCFEAVKAYPKLDIDASQIKYKTHGKLIFKMGHTDGDECATDMMDVKADIVGERLEEQVEEMKNYVKPGSCFKNASNPLDLDITKPFDWNCLYQTVKSSTMRKYTVDITYGEMPTEYSAKLHMVEDLVRSVTWPEISYRPEHTEKGHAKVYMTYPSHKNYGNITFVTPSYTWELIDVIYEEDEIDKRHNDLVFDNTVFSTTFLVDFYKDDIRPCIAHAHDLINDMNQTIPMEFKDWTLMSGDHGLMSYAVLVKIVGGDKVAVRIYVPDHVLEVNPGETKPAIILDGNVIPYDDEEISLPTFDTTNYKITTVNKIIVIETEKYSKVKVYYTPHNVIVLPHIIFDRNVDGVCGHMGTTTYTQQAPLVLGSA
uniref:Vg6 n=1 Tax=Tetrastichus brontispae TaxID=2033808 RepID=A0A650FKU3_9HYME|nr:Vg6 [Tetrastichus brontispae]